VDPLNGLSQISQILRQKFSERSQQATRKKIGTSVSDAYVPSRAGTKASAEEIKRKIHERIKGLSAAERKGKRGAQIFIELVLLWDFGDHLLRDPQFTELSKEVVEAMAGNCTVWRQLQKLLEEIGSASG